MTKLTTLARMLRLAADRQSVADITATQASNLLTELRSGSAMRVIDHALSDGDAVDRRAG